ncbi:MAG: hypothetical protein ACYTBJ_18890 [Planctomycetota bacterium]|jgi:hypothetical protein
MLKKVKFSKVLAVIFLTLLIWVWADLALDEEHTVYSAAVTDATSNARLWVSFGDSEPSAAIKELVLKGPRARIADLRKTIKTREGLTFDFDAAAEKMDEPGPHPLPLMDFLQKHSEIRKYGVKLVSCKPEKIQVNVTTLAQTWLHVTCCDQDGNPVPAEIKPQQVQMYVPEQWPAEKRVALVRLTQAERIDATTAPIMQTPFVELAPTELREADTPVEVKILSQLAPASITPPRIGFSMSATLMGKYKPEIVNRDVYALPIQILATLEARQEYEKSAFHATLEIYESDLEKEPPLKRKLIYNFPLESVRREEIKLNQASIEVEFRLIDLSAPPVAAPPAGG